LGGSNPADFALVPSATTCAATLAAGAACKITLAFTPASTGSLGATLSIAYSGQVSAVAVALGGTGLQPMAIVAPPPQLVAGTSFQFTSNQPAIWTATSGTISNSGAFVAPNPPPNPAVVTITATSTTYSQVIASVQVNIAAQPSLAFPSTNLLPAGKSVNIKYSIPVGAGIGGESYSLACTPATLPSSVTCSFNPDPIVLVAGGTSGTLTITSNQLASLDHDRVGLSPLGSALAVLACCFFITFRRRRRNALFALLLAGASTALLAISACGTSGSLKLVPQPGYVTGTFVINVSVTGATAGAPDFNQTVAVSSLTVTIQ